MTEPYFTTADGLGLEGFLSYANNLVDGWLAILFLTFIWITTTYTLSKSEHRMPGVLAFAFFITFITGMIMKLFMDVGDYILFILAIGLGLSIAWSVANGRGGG